MALKRMSLNNTTSNGFAFLVYGPFAVGKTRLVGDALGWMRDQGGKILFVDVNNESGYSSISGYGLGDVGVKVDSVDDLDELTKELSKNPYDMVVFDTLSGISRLCMYAVVGKKRLPQVGGSADNEWGKVNRRVENTIADLKRVARFTLFTAPAIRKEVSAFSSTVDGMVTTVWMLPSLDGSQSTNAIGWFDFVSYLHAEVGPDGTTTRSLMLRPFPPSDPLAADAKSKERAGIKPAIMTRQRLARMIDFDIHVPHGGGAWATLMSVIESHSRND